MHPDTDITFSMQGVKGAEEPLVDSVTSNAKLTVCLRVTLHDSLIAIMFRVYMREYNNEQ